MPLLPQVWRSESVAKVSYSMFPLHLHFCFLGTGGMAGVSGLWSPGGLSRNTKRLFSPESAFSLFSSLPQFRFPRGAAAPSYGFAQTLPSRGLRCHVFYTHVTNPLFLLSHI